MKKFKVALKDKEPLSEGVKHSDGKARFDLIPPLPLIEVAHVYGMGGKKYEDRNWEKGVPWCKYFAAMQRHMQAWLAGEDYDRESGLHHMAHAAWGCLTLIEYARTHPELDNRTQYKVESVDTVYKKAPKRELSKGSEILSHREAALREIQKDAKSAIQVYYEVCSEYQKDMARRMIKVLECLTKEVK